MAVSLSRLTWNVVRRNQSQYQRLLLVASVNGRGDPKSFSTQRENPTNSKKYSKLVRNVVTYALLTSGLGYLFYKRKDDLQDSFQRLSLTIPTVKALSIPILNQYRDKYNFIADVVEVSAPAVVYIEIIDKRKSDFFTGRPIPVSNGSGFIVGEDGLILTNAHVVINKPHSTVKVRLHDGNIYTGIVEEVDMHSDLATVRINKKNLPVMKLGTSSNIRPGEFVVAIGSPLSLSNTITSGIISSVHRPSEELGLYNKQMSYIQTDAAITFGNSGGPLVNLSGEAIGINSMKVTAGISFAIPIDYAKEFLQRAEQRRKAKSTKDVKEDAKRRYLGITMVSLTPDLLFELHQRTGGVLTSIRHGVLIFKVVQGSPAHAGGLQAGDIVTHVNDEPVFTTMNVYQALEKPGRLQLAVVRNGVVLHITVDPENV